MLRNFVLDTETASDKDGCGVCDIFFIEVDDNLQVVSTFGSMIDPEMPICPSASGVHNITNCMVENEPTLEEYLNIVNVREAGIAAHNAQFDIDKIKRLVSVPLSIDTLRIAQRYVEGHPTIGSAP